MKLLMLKGLPASGKSTYACELAQSPTWKRINKDDIRAMVDGGKWSKDNEKTVLETRNTLINLYLKNGFDVVVDDTNFEPKHEAILREIAEEYKAEFEVKFFDLDYRKCIERDLKRPNSVGKDVIVGMWKKYIIPRLEWPKDRESKPRCIIVDIDGTVAKIGDRSAYSQNNEDYLKDTVNHDVAMEVIKRGLPVVFCSGRSSALGDVTEQWLTKHGLYTETSNLFMRGEDDTRPDWIVKYDILKNIIAENWNPVAVYDDRQQVCDMWRAQGLRVYQVDDGNF